MVVNLSMAEANMLLDAANRMEAEDIWESYTDAEDDALKSAQKKLGQAIGYAESKKAAKK